MLRCLLLALLALTVMAPAGATALQPHALGLKPAYRQGDIVRGHWPEAAKVTLGDKPLRLGPDGQFVFGIGRDEQRNQRLTLVDQQGRVSTLDIQVQAREYRIQRVEGVPQQTVTPPEEELARIRQEAALARKARDVDSDRLDFAGAFRWPLLGPITGVYGSQRVYNGEPKNPHFGVDVAGPTGALVSAPIGGLVRLAHPDMFFSGGTLIIDHGHGLTSTFMHLSAILVEEGQQVSQGDPIAKVGATGRATGPHLDWRMNWFDVRVDPQSLMAPMPKQP